MKTKKCTRCGKTLFVSEFGISKNTEDGLNCNCKKCLRKQAKAYRAKHPAKAKANWEKYHKSKKGQLAQRNRHLKHKYKITLDEYMEMLEGQKGVCAVCSRPETYKTNAKTHHTDGMLSVDHDHTTGKVRSLLCRRCNIVLGQVCEDKNLLLKLAIYIENHKEK